MKIFFLLTAIFILSGCHKYESASGYLYQASNGQCFLLAQPTQVPITNPCKEGDLLCETKKVQTQGLTQGLEQSFCDANPTALNQQVTVQGVRASGSAIGQDCTNRNCFHRVGLK